MSLRKIENSETFRSNIRKKIDERIKNVEVIVPEFKYCTDNAAMIGVAGYYQYLKTKKTDNMELNGFSRINLV